MEEFESKANSTAPNPPRLSLRYMNDIFAIQQAEHSQQLLQNINSIAHIYNSPERFPAMMDPSPSWTPYFPQDQTTHY